MSGSPARSRPQPSAREVRRLGAVFLVAALFLSALCATKARSGHWPWQIAPAILFAVLGSACALMGERARGIHRAWTAFGDALGRVVSPLVLAVLYFTVLTPFGLAFRLLRGDVLGRRPDAKIGTYWKPPATPKTTPERLLRQY